ncbi:MAG: translation elongation factor Ts [Coriobacteriales bacterium]|jgi:elongation factor Ts|nr:translation elongation factor Ts [Coriobacteriales bacterium]
MGDVTAQMVKELREATSAGMMECKKALVEAAGDMEKAVDVLRTHGLAAAAKKAGRATNEGVIYAAVSDDAKTGVLLEANCETDFVSANDVFRGYVEKFGQAVMQNNPADVDALKESELGGEKIGDVLTEAIHKIGENIQISRFLRKTTDGTFAVYTHNGARLGVLVEFSTEKPETTQSDAFKQAARDICLQITATNPGALDRDSFAPEVIEHEMSIYKAQAADSGKPENIQEKIAQGRMNKFYKESALVEQEFVKDPDVTIKDYLAKVSKGLGDKIAIKAFYRYELGQE